MIAPTYAREALIFNARGGNASCTGGPAGRIGLDKPSVMSEVQAAAPWSTHAPGQPFIIRGSASTHRPRSRRPAAGGVPS